MILACGEHYKMESVENKACIWHSVWLNDNMSWRQLSRVVVVVIKEGSLEEKNGVFIKIRKNAPFIFFVIHSLS